MIDRLSIRERPSGQPILHQTWDKLLFLHWRIPEEQLRPLVPKPLQIDTYDGDAWIGVTPFTIRDLRPAMTPALPGVSSTHEINVRTYVYAEGVPGIWFLSLDASNPLAVLGARAGFSLPYYQANITLEEKDRTYHFTSRRRHMGAPRAEFDARWREGEPLGEAEPGSLDFFLVERYCLYTGEAESLERVRIHHRPWPLQTAEVLSLSSTMIESHGLAAPSDEPIVHLQEAPLEVGVWPMVDI